MKKVAIVILNWNGEQMLRRFLPSVLQYSEAVADIVVADNASTDASLALLEKKFPTVRTANVLAQRHCAYLMWLTMQRRKCAVSDCLILVSRSVLSSMHAILVQNRKCCLRKLRVARLCMVSLPTMFVWSCRQSLPRKSMIIRYCV